MFTCGIDIGSLSSKAAIMDDGKIVSWILDRTGPDSIETSNKVMEATLSKANLKMSDIAYIVSTGYGRVVVPFANKSITEISCHAKGANYFFPRTRTILDMGGQDCKAIRCDETGKVKAFIMNDKCAAGAGRYMEVVADLINEPLEEIGSKSLKIIEKVQPITSNCAVFAKSEIMTLLRSGVYKNDIMAGVCDALAIRVVELLQKVEVEKELSITGGIGKNIGVVQRVEEKIGMKAEICFEPQIVGAIGAAIFARERAEKELAKGKKA